MNNNSSKRLFFVEAANEVVAAHRGVIEAVVNAPVRRLAMSVAPEVVALRDVDGPQEIILALQHYPQYIEKMLGTLQFDFEIQEGTELFIPEDQWKKKPGYMRWFRRMSEFECMPFFMKDRDVRLYILAGDYLAKGNTVIESRETEAGRFKYMIRGGIITELSKRLTNCCRMFMLYCHGSGFDPKNAIASMLSDYSLPVHYADIYKQYKKDIQNFSANMNASHMPGGFRTV